MTNQTTNQNQTNWNAIDNILSTLAEGKGDTDKLFTPIYICNKYDSNGFCESHITVNEAFAMQCDDYEFISLSELNNVTASLGKMFEGTLLVSEGLCEYESGEYRLLSDIPRYSRFTSGHELYINQLYNTCNENVNSFIAWMTDVNHYPIDGYIVRNLKQYIDSKDKLTAFFQRFADVYKYDSSMLTQCSIDMIDYYKENPLRKVLINN